MIKKSILQANFEESLNLEEDGFLKLQMEQHNKIAQSYKNGVPSWRFRIRNFLLTLIFPVGFNYLLQLASVPMMSESKLNFQPSNYNFLTPQVYCLLLGLWLLLILVGKLFHQSFILPYRYQFHFMTYGIVLYIELDLLVLGLLLSNLHISIVIGMMIVWLSLIVFMITRGVGGLRKLIYNETQESGLREKIAKAIGLYGLGILGIMIVVQKVLSLFMENQSGLLEDLGMLLVWMVINVLMPAVIIFVLGPYFLQGYYKLKYPEAYRKYEMKTLEEWYGKRYLKKHPELLEKGDYNQPHDHKEDAI